MSRTVWLASYPKSGNTWFRIFLANLLQPKSAPVDINQLTGVGRIASCRQCFDDLLGVPSALLTPLEVARLRPAADQGMSTASDADFLPRKVHDAYTWLGDGRPLLGRGPDFSVIYILRDPWDVAVSMVNHFDCSLDEAVAFMCDPSFTLAEPGWGLKNQLPQRLLSWEGHALSWLAAPMDLHLLRYEEMLSDPLPAFRGAVAFLGLKRDDAAIAAALEASRFERLQALEQERRFQEAPLHTARFFRSGKMGEGLAAHSAEQLARLVAMKQQVETGISHRRGAA